MNYCLILFLLKSILLTTKCFKIHKSYREKKSLYKSAEGKYKIDFKFCEFYVTAYYYRNS